MENSQNTTSGQSPGSVVVDSGSGSNDDNLDTTTTTAAAAVSDVMAAQDADTSADAAAAAPPPSCSSSPAAVTEQHDDEEMEAEPPDPTPTAAIQASMAAAAATESSNAANILRPQGGGGPLHAPAIAAATTLLTSAAQQQNLQNAISAITAKDASNITSFHQSMLKSPPPLSSSVLANGALGDAGSTSIPPTVLTGEAALKPPAALAPIPDDDSPEIVALKQARLPLTNVFGKLVTGTDTCVADARHRLRQALAQTRALQDSFTERVYEKYRICLVPPLPLDRTLVALQAAPVTEAATRASCMQRLRIEKEAEKKQGLAEDGYYSAGLHLVILPEDVLPATLQARYTERGPTNELGHKSKVLSQAAATAGEVMLDKTRKAAALKVERQRGAHGHTIGVAANTHPPISPEALLPSKSPPRAALSTPLTHAAVAAAKNKNRGGAASTLSASTLLSLNPHADEFKAQGRMCAATAALCSMLPQLSSTNHAHRWQHPFAASAGGQRRILEAGSNGGHPPATFGVSNMRDLNLPPLPTPKERKDSRHKPVPTKSAASEAPSLAPARAAVAKVLKHFVPDDAESPGDLQELTRIGILHSVRKSSQTVAQQRGAALISGAPVSAAAPAASAAPVPEPSATMPPPPPLPAPAEQDKKLPVNPNAPIDPVLAFSVMHHIGLIARPHARPDDPRRMFRLPTPKTSLSSKLQQLRLKLIKRGVPNKTVTGTLVLGKNSVHKRTSDDEPTGNPVAKKMRPTVDVPTSVPAASIRGGRDDSFEIPVPETSVLDPERKQSSNDNTNVEAVDSKTESGPQEPTQVDSGSGDKSTSAPTVPPNPSGNEKRPYQHANFRALFMGRGTGFPSHVQHPAGEVAGGIFYGAPPPGYDMAAILSGSAGIGNGSTAPFTALQNAHNHNFVGYSIEEREAAVRALYAQEHHHATAFFRGVGHPQFANPGVNGATPLLSTPLGLSPGSGRPRAWSHSMFQTAAGSGFADSKTASTSGATTTGGTKIGATPVAAAKAVHGSNTDNTSTVASTDETMKTPNAKLAASAQAAIVYRSPPKPALVSETQASRIEAGRFHEVIISFLDSNGRSAALDYLVAVGTAVPIPKALISHPLKDRLNTPGFKSTTGGTPAIPRDMMACAILVWLWSNHAGHFRRAFEKNGRFDVDPDCKWLIQAAVDTCVRDLTLEIADSIARGEGAFAEASAQRKAAAKAGGSVPSTDHDKPAISRRVEIHTAAIVCKSLMAKLCVDAEINTVVANFPTMTSYLDEVRMCALRAKSQERVLLATLIARRATMAESFSHAYVSAMVRAGETLGHGRLFESVQNEEVSASTMIPYDIFSDEANAWEDPCKPERSVSSNVSADDLVRRAHARAMIQKSLRKLQDRHNIRGGTTSYGPYTDPASAEGQSHAAAFKARAAVWSPRPSGTKRRAYVLLEPPIQPGTGSASATSWNLYEPRHASHPMVHDPDSTENKPYGRYCEEERARSISASLSERSTESKKKKAKLMAAAAPLYGSVKGEDSVAMPRSTREIDWADVAGIFQTVDLQAASRKSQKPDPNETVETAESGTAARDRRIYAPFCRKAECDLLEEHDDDDDDDSSDEDVSDEAVLARHQVVLDDMKAKLAVYLEARQRQQERRKNRHKDKS